MKWDWLLWVMLALAVAAAAGGAGGMRGGLFGRPNVGTYSGAAFRPNFAGTGIRDGAR